MQPPTLQRGRWIVVAPVLAALLLGCTSDEDGAGDSTTTSAVEAAPRVLRLGVVELDTLDPARAGVTEQSEMIAADLLYDGLTTFDPDSRTVEPGLAEWTANDDLTVWTFTLRDDATFSDGSPIEASDVKASLERVASPDSGSLAGLRLDVIDGYRRFVEGEEVGLVGVKAEDERTVVIETREPYSPLPELLASPAFGVLPAGDIALAEAFFEAPVGSGPVAFVEQHEGTAVLEARDGLGFDRIELVGFESVGKSFEAFEEGDVDWSLVPAGKVADAVEEYGSDAVSPFHAVLFYGINVGNPTYADRDFREALVRAVDREAVVEVFGEHSSGRKLNGLIPEGVGGHREYPCGEVCSHDPDAARALLEEAFGDGERPTVRLDFFEGEREQAMAEAIKEDLEEVGLEVRLRPRPAEEYDRFVVSSDQEVFLFGWPGLVTTADPYLAPLFLTDSADNVTAFGSDAIDAGLAAARGTADAEERAEAYSALETAILGQAPVIPLVQFETAAVVSDRVSGFVPRIDGTFVVEGVEVDGE